MKNRESGLILTGLAVYAAVNALAVLEVNFWFPKEKTLGGHLFFIALMLSPVIAILCSIVTLHFVVRSSASNVRKIIYGIIGNVPFFIFVMDCLKVFKSGGLPMVL